MLGMVLKICEILSQGTTSWDPATLRHLEQAQTPMPWVPKGYLPLV